MLVLFPLSLPLLPNSLVVCELSIGLPSMIQAFLTVDFSLVLLLCISNSAHSVISIIFNHIFPWGINTYFCLPPCIFRTVGNSQMDTSTTSATEASASSSTGSSVVTDTGLDLTGSRKEEGTPADPSLRSQSQYTEDKEMLETKKDQQFG